MTATIHPTAFVDPKAQLGNDVEIGAFCVVGEHVTLKDGVKLWSHVVVDGITTIGERTEIYPFSVIGCSPPDRKYKGEPSRLVVGADNIIREHVTMHTGTANDRMETVVGNGGLFMAGTHVAHDCVLGDNVIMANQSAIAGHVSLGDNVIIGGLSGVMQRVRVGEGAIIGFLSAVENDVIPYGLVHGERAYLDGINIIGLERRGVDKESIASLQKAYKTLFLGEGGTFAERLNALQNSGTPQIQVMLDFIMGRGNRPLCQPSQ